MRDTNNFPTRDMETYVDTWKKVFRSKESDPTSGMDYRVGSMETGDLSQVARNLDKVRELHGEELSVFLDILSQDGQEDKERVCVLDVGGGIGLAAEQIRQDLGVRVITTGLSRRSAQKARLAYNNNPDNSFKLPDRLSSDDLKWNSILQLRRPNPEFNLIIDTYGEHWHDVCDNGNLLDFKKLRVYLEIIINKLKPGGLASVLSMIFMSEFVRHSYLSLLDELKQKHPDIEIDLSERKENPSVLTIKKLFSARL